MDNLFNSPSDRIAFQPRGEDGPTYYLRQPLAKDRGKILAAAGQSGFHFWGRIAALRAAIDRLEKSEQYDVDFGSWRELIDLYAGRVREAADVSLSENTEESRRALGKALEEPPPLTQIVNHIRAEDQEFDYFINRGQAYALHYGTEAARLFLVGWKGPGLGKFKRDMTGATNTSLLKILESDLIDIGEKVKDLLEPKPDAVGNSDSASSTPPTPISSSDGKNTRRKHPANGATSEATAAHA